MTKSIEHNLTNNTDNEMSGENLVKECSTFDTISKERLLEKKNLIHRLHRIEGQIRGIQKMIQEDRDCLDIITQVSASLSALENVSLIILEQHIKGYLKNIKKNSKEEESIDLLVEVIKRVLK
jgi:hypothetical protein